MSQICKNCGKELNDKFNFCVFCGERLPNSIPPKLDNEILNVIESTDCDENIKKFLIEVFTLEVQLKESGSFHYRKDYEKILSSYIE